MRTILLALAMAAGLALLAPGARGHIGPSVDANNRYLRLAPMRDRVRLAYTVFLGEVPGAQARLRMDGDGDGAISERESRAYAGELAALVAANLAVTWDGAPREVAWAEMHVGLGTAATRAGSFSVDLIAYVCGQDAGSHQLVVYDRYRMPRPGETEVRVQPSPGITVTRAALGADSASVKLEHAWQGSDAPMAQQGFYLDYEVDPATAPLVPEGECGRPVEAAQGRSAAVLLGLIAALAAVVIAAVRRRIRSCKDR